MERETLEGLWRILHGDLMKQEKRIRKPVSVEKHVAVGLFINFPLEKNYR